MERKLGALLAWLAACPVACLAIADVGDLVVVDDAGVGGSAAEAGAGGEVGAGGHGCTTPTECPETMPACEIWTCPAGWCELAAASAGTACSSDGGQVCSDDGRCVECLSDQHCPGEYCDPGENICAPLKPLGASCSRGGECESGRCHAVDQVCVAP